MKVAFSPNLRQAFMVLVSISVILAGALVVTRWLPKAPPMVVAASTPAESDILVFTATVTPDNRPAAYLDSTKLGTTMSIKVDLPAPWRVLHINSDYLDKVMNELDKDTTNQPNTAAIKTLLRAIDRNSTALVAVLMDTQAKNQPLSLPNLTIMVTSRNNLSLAQYIDGVVAELKERPGVTIQETKVDYALRSNGLPVATLHYTMDVGLLPDATTPVDGYQVAAFDAKATNMILFTFTAPTARYPELLPMFQKIVRTAQLN